MDAGAQGGWSHGIHSQEAETEVAGAHLLSPFHAAQAADPGNGSIHLYSGPSHFTPD